MMKNFRRTTFFLLLVLSFIVPLSAQEADNCLNAASRADALLIHAQELITAGEVDTAQAVISGARALIAQCLLDAPQDAPEAGVTTEVELLEFAQGFGARGSFWQVYFTAPTGTTDRTTYTGGVDTALTEAINNVQTTLDIAAFEWNNPLLTQAVIDAHERGVQVRMVVDDEHTLEDEDTTIEAILDAGIPVIDDSRGGLMHNKFMIMDSSTVWMGSMNYTINGSYRNNNNMLVMQSPEIAAAYTLEFLEMFQSDEFGSSRSARNGTTTTIDGTPVQVVFAPEDEVVPALIAALNTADENIRFMTFSFTLDDIGQVLLEKAQAGLDVQGIFEVRGSRTTFSELPLLFCNGLDIKEDGNRFTYHHKVFIIDDDTVVTGSFNISDSATNNNDENMVIIQNPAVAALYIAEFERNYAMAQTPPAAEITCP